MKTHILSVGNFGPVICDEFFFFTIFIIFYFMHMGVFFALRSEVGIKSFGTGIKGGSELPCGSWELNSGLLEEQRVLQFS